MDKIRRIAELMKGNRQKGQVFFSAIIESIEGNTCTVSISGFPITDVRLRATTTTAGMQVYHLEINGQNIEIDAKY